MLRQIIQDNVTVKDFLCVPVGGCGEFGMNATMYHYANSNILVDAGILFSDPHLLGVDGLFPDIAKIIAEIGKISAYVITHGHEDHIGALPFFYQTQAAPIYATPWTALLIKKKVSSLGMEQLLDDIRLVQAGDVLEVPPFKIEYIHVNHSIPMACSLHIRAGAFSVFHSGDFKIDAKSDQEPVTNISRIKQLGKQGIDLALVDSTNASSAGHSGSESGLVSEFSQILSNHPGRVFLTTFSSNFWRLNSIIQACLHSHRRLCILSQSMKNTLDFGREFGQLAIDSPLFIPQDEVDFLADDQIALLVSGCQGEWLSGLYRLAQNEFGSIKVKEGDLFIFSSRIIPGNEKSVLRVMNNLKRNGAIIISQFTDQSVHVSGHAYADEIKVMAKALNAKNYVPVHGTFSHLKAHSDLIESITPRSKGTRCIIGENNAAFILKEDKSLQYFPPPPAFSEFLFLDSDSRMSLSKTQVKERLKLGELGGVFCSLVCHLGHKIVIKHSIWKNLGLPFDDILFSAQVQKLEDRLSLAIQENFSEKRRSISDADLSEWLRIYIRRFFANLLNKKIVVVIALHIEDTY